MFCDVYISYPLDEWYTYHIPEGMHLPSYCRVRVNFSGRNLTAYVHRVHETEPAGFEVKDVISVVDDEPIFDDRLMKLAHYTASNYLSSVGEALSIALPAGFKPSKRYKIPFDRNVSEQEIILNDDQKRIFNDIMEFYKTNVLTHLIFGITGSGKTEIYIEIAKNLIAKGHSVIYLVPEISLSSMIFDRLYGVFGDELIIYHSHLTPNQRLYNWIRFYRGEAHIAVGTRSAVFLQCPKLGMIVVDEEHDGSYKEHSTPRYNARRIALYRSRMEGALVVMGSATPAVESLYACEKDVMKLHTLKNRYGNARLPEIDIVRIGSTKPKHIISPILKIQTKRAIEEGHQAIYLLNRRGFAPVIICSQCGWTLECPHCSIGMNYHKDRHMLCHYCGHQQAVPVVCAKCGSEQLDKVGSGTQRIEEIIEKEFPDYAIFRLDQDSSRKKNTMPELITRMSQGEVDILVGTQLVAKGLDFHNITMVGVILADIGMNMPDFRSGERIFSLLMQVAGRSGRGDAPGKVIIQTLDDQNPLFRFIKNHDYFGFYRSELDARKMLQYPPFTRLARLLVRGKSEEKVIASINSLKKSLEEQAVSRNADMHILGPASAPFAKIGGNYRHHIIVKSSRVGVLQEVIAASRSVITGRDVYLEIDIDPYELM